jgi:hypothetical protein
LPVGEISGTIKGVSVLSERELSVVSVSKVDDVDDDPSSQLVRLVRLRDGSHKIVLPYSWTGSNRHTIKNNEEINRTEFNHYQSSTDNIFIYHQFSTDRTQSYSDRER